jgi:hypothetical protein
VYLQGFFVESQCRFHSLFSRFLPPIIDTQTTHSMTHGQKRMHNVLRRIGSVCHTTQVQRKNSLYRSLPLFPIPLKTPEQAMYILADCIGTASQLNPSFITFKTVAL